MATASLRAFTMAGAVFLLGVSLAQAAAQPAGPYRHRLRRYVTPHERREAARRSYMAAYREGAARGRTAAAHGRYRADLPAAGATAGATSWLRGFYDGYRTAAPPARRTRPQSITAGELIVAIQHNLDDYYTRSHMPRDAQSQTSPEQADALRQQDLWCQQQRVQLGRQFYPENYPKFAAFCKKAGIFK